jgi:hypothetical protein
MENPGVGIIRDQMPVVNIKNMQWKNCVVIQLKLSKLI